VISKLSELPLQRSCIVSRYIFAPLLVHQRKFDLRMYVLVTCFNPLRIYLYTNGLARFCTTAYDTSKKNLHKKYMHLTNFSVNKKAANFKANQAADGVGAAATSGPYANSSSADGASDSSKWSLRAFKLWLERTYGPARCAEVWGQVTDIFVKTLLSVESSVSTHVARLAAGRRDLAFECFGFDILLDENLKPWLMEVRMGSEYKQRSTLLSTYSSCMCV